MQATGALVLLTLAAACSPRAEPTAGERPARPSDPAAPATSTASLIGESCAATADCDRDLRCVDGACLPARSSRLGDFHWAAGRGALDRGDAIAATEALQRAVTAYDADQLAVPAALLCDAGAALARRQGDARAGEQAARLLHRCVLEAPAGGRDYRRGLAELVGLESAGFEPTLVAKDSPADRYLIGTARPAGEPAIAVVPVASAKDKGFAAFATALPVDAKAALIGCHKLFVASTKKNELAVGLDLKNHAILGDDDAVVGGKLEVTLAAAAMSDAQAGECVRAAVARSAELFSRDRRASSGSWSATITVTVGSKP
jgi:hypothetical protein